MTKTTTVLSTLLLLVMASCQQEQAETVKEPEPQAEQSESKEPAPEEKETAADKEPAQQAPAVQDIETITNNACLAAVKKETGESDVSVTSNEFSEANTLVMLGVGAQRAPWRCLVSSQGQVAEISFEGDDSAGAPDQEQSSSDVSSAAMDACLNAVSAETGEDDVSVLSSEFSEANSLVMVGVGVQRALWRCLVSNDGQVQEVSSQADEGNL